MSGNVGPDTGRMRQLSYDLKLLEKARPDLFKNVSSKEFSPEKLNKWLKNQGVNVPDTKEMWDIPQYQHGGAVFESAPADETAHDQMNNLIFENEMKQSQGASPLSFVNKDRIDSQNQSLMDAVMSMSLPAAGALSIGKSAFGKFANLPRAKVLSQIPVMKEIGKINWNQFAKKGMPKSAKKSFENIKDLNWLEDLIRRNQ